MASSRHNTDKENVYKTRIPVPKDPLPALPKYLLVNNKIVHKPGIPQRNPLKVINAQSTSTPKAGPSKVVPYQPKQPENIFTKNVTMRQRNEDLDWHYTVFNDERDKDKNASVLSISDDERYLKDKGSQRYFVENKKTKVGGAVLSAVTPNLKASLEPNRVRNIKRSLKRPHSREIQGLSPLLVTGQEKSDDKVRRCLNFNEGIQDALRTPDFWQQSYMRSFNQDYATDLFEYLLVKEIKPLKMPSTSNITRACVINWLMKVNGPAGNPAVIQTACWYFDSVLGIGHVQLDKLQVVAAACFWIAQKLSGPYKRAIRLVEHSNLAFTTDQLLAAEKAVLIRLKFPNQPIVAQDYIPYLSWWCDKHNSGAIEVAATFLTMCGLLADRVLCDEYPSVIAVAAVRNALLLLRKKELIPRLQMCHIFIVAEKKATNLYNTCLILRRAVRMVAAPFYDYKAPLEHYGMPPCCIAQRIIHAVIKMSIMGAKDTEGH